MKMRGGALALALLFMAACGAPVYHVVRPGETLYSISFRYGKDYRQMAEWNNLAEPYQVSSGQHLRIISPRRDAFAAQSRALPSQTAAPATRTATASAPSSGAVEVYGLNEAPRPSVAPAPAPVPASAAAPAAAMSGWQWPTARPPARSAVTSGTADKGIDIRGERGEAVRAAAAGSVVYSGNGIPHYGNLLILKHDDHFLSAYAHNEHLLVGEGDTVTAGEPIAEMGDSGTGTDAVKLHFEIRRDGEPVDPLKYLPGL
ncbi:MAG: peptidoglycan DD-metalloendopeptidase family protein [Gammaproteobacteria bacterium]|nr:peptidoglycan DD-metalloendopeptidase family protein [Gammaproteobacteria bacterium]